MDLKLQAVVLPVSDVERAKRFYEALGFRTDLDRFSGETFRMVQLTPPGSSCSIIIGIGISPAEPGSLRGLHLVVSDVTKARDQLIGHGADLNEVGHAAIDLVTPARSSGPYASFDDPDGNRWYLHQASIG